MYKSVRKRDLMALDPDGNGDRSGQEEVVKAAQVVGILLMFYKWVNCISISDLGVTSVWGAN